MTWNEQREAALKQMWNAEELTAGQIATKLGTTRNAVIGKVSRLKLPRRKPDVSARTKAAISRARRVIKKPVLMPDAGPIRKKAALPRGGHRMTKRIAHRQCQYPIGEIGPTDGWKCGADTYRSSYCEEHYTISYPPWRQKQLRTLTELSERDI